MHGAEQHLWMHAYSVICSSILPSSRTRPCEMTMDEYVPTPTNASAAVYESCFWTINSTRTKAVDNAQREFFRWSAQNFQGLLNKVEKGTQDDDRMDDVLYTYFACACVYDDSSGTTNEETFWQNQPEKLGVIWLGTFAADPSCTTEEEARKHFVVCSKGSAGGCVNHEGDLPCMEDLFGMWEHTHVLAHTYTHTKAHINIYSKCIYICITLYIW